MEASQKCIKHEKQVESRQIMKALVLILTFASAGATSRNLHTDEKFHSDTQKMTSSRSSDEASEWVVSNSYKKITLFSLIRRKMQLCYAAVSEEMCLQELYNHDYFWL